MNKVSRDATDVLVIGSGIAGITAAIEAARSGARVAIASAGRFLSGSSFYPGTWGLGLIGPESPADADDLVRSILDVGQGVADPAMVRAFVEGIPRAIEWLQDDLGVQLKKPQSDASAQEAAFIPCFDHKHRLWRGITRGALEEAARREVSARAIEVLEHVELIDLLSGDDGVCGAVLYDRAREQLAALRARAVIICSGGTSGLYARRLTSADVLGSAHATACAAGCELVNIEFMQMMPGLVAPVAGLVFNEKTFRYLRPSACGGRLAGLDPDELAELLEQRSGHGPFTARLADHVIDLAIDEAGLEGLAARYELPPVGKRPEFVQEFATWLEREHGIMPGDELRIAMYAHASNGGIRIDADGWTGVDGLYACGEATGGMHGADRIGGLSSANGLVFGRRAGRAAARRSMGLPRAGAGRCVADWAEDRGHLLGIDPQRARELYGRLRETMSRHAMINRDDEGLSCAEAEVRAMLDELQRDARPQEALHDAACIAAHARLQSQLDLALRMLKAMRSRRENLGSHYRSDAPA